MAGDATERTAQPPLSKGAWPFVRTSLSSVMILTLVHLIGAAYVVELRRHEMGDYLRRLYLASPGSPGLAGQMRPVADKLPGERGVSDDPEAASRPKPDEPASLARPALLRES